MSRPVRNSTLLTRWQIPLPVVWLVVAAVGSQLLLWWLKPPPPQHTAAGPPRSDYTLRNFHLQVLNRDGSVAVRLKAPRLVRRNGSGALYLTAPHFDLPSSDGSQWLGDAQRGWVGASGSELKLLGKVHMQRPATATVGKATVDSANITAWPDQHRLQTAASAVLREPGRILRGTGLKVDLAHHTLELMADVHGTFQAATH